MDVQNIRVHGSELHSQQETNLSSGLSGPDGISSQQHHGSKSSDHRGAIIRFSAKADFLSSADRLSMTKDMIFLLRAVVPEIGLSEYGC